MEWHLQTLQLIAAQNEPTLRSFVVQATRKLSIFQTFEREAFEDFCWHKKFVFPKMEELKPKNKIDSEKADWNGKLFLMLYDSDYSSIINIYFYDTFSTFRAHTQTL